MAAPKRQPAFQFYPSAWFSSLQVTTMSAEEEGTYIRLLGHQWISRTLPVDPKELQRLTKLTPAQWKKAWQKLEQQFPLTADGKGRANLTLESVRDEREAFIESRRVNGAAGGKVAAKKRRARIEHHTSIEAAAERESRDETDSTCYPSATANEQQNGSTCYSVATPSGVANVVASEQLDSSSVSGSGTDIPPSPPPGGGGASPNPPPPTPPPPAGAFAHRAAKAGEPPTSAALPSDAAAAIASETAAIGHAAGRQAVVRFLSEQRVLVDRIANWVRRVEGWTNGLGTSGMRPVAWEAVVQGIEELLDTNPPGQTITPAQLLTFVERAERTRTAPEYSPRGAAASGGSSRQYSAAERAAADRQVLVDYARQGDEHAIAECARLGIDYARAIA